MKILSNVNSLDYIQDGDTRILPTKTESSGNGNVVSSISISGDTITYNKGVTALTAHQNAFSNVKVGSTAVAADSAGDTLELVAGDNITLTPDATNDKVTIAASQPTVNNGTLTIQKNGTNVQTFSANQSSNVTANITVPTKVSQLTNDSGYTTNVGTITGITMNGASKGTSGVVDLGTVITDKSDKVSKTGDTMTGTLVAPIIQTGTAATNYFQSQKFRGQGDASSYQHALDFGYSGHNQWDFYEYGGVFNFHKHTAAAVGEGDTLLGTINSNGWEGNVKGNVTGNLTGLATKATGDKNGNDITTTYYLASNPNGYTSNTGTITGISVNGTSIATSGVANITSMPASILSGAIPSAVTATTQSAGDNSTKIATTAYVDSAITALPEPMIFKGSLGTDGTITDLPTAASTNEGFTYKVITAGTYASQAAKVGDTFISDGTAWILIPSGDEPSGTVTSIKIQATAPIAVNSSSTITTSGTRTISHATSGVTAGTYRSVTVNETGHVTAGTNPTTLSGYGITDAKIASGVITLGSNTITPLTSTGLTNENLNNITTPGLYYAGGSNSTTNKPSNVDAYGLKVYKTANGYITQELIEGNTTAGKRWTRQYNANTWSSWSEMKWTDTTYSAGTGLSLSGTTINHSNSVTAGTAGTSSATSGSTLAVPYVTYDAQGHVTASGTHTHTITGFATTDTKNTAGSTDTSSKIFLIGATSQAANPQTYSDNEVYATSGVLTTKSVQVGGTAATIQYNSTDKCIEFVFA